MPRLTPIDWKTLVRVFEADGFKVDRSKGSHIVLTKPGVLRAIVIPRYDELGLDIITNNMRSAGMSRERYLALLDQIKN